MHIPNEFLDPKISTGLIGVAVAVLGISFAKVKEAVTALQPAEALATAGRNVGSMAGRMRRVLTGNGEQTIYKMGMVAALVFSAQMFNFPINQGTSGHMLGGVFSFVILGPFAGSIVMAVVLLVQSLFFADGGLLAIGANIVNMAVVGTFLVYYLYILIRKVAPEWLAIAIAAWLSVTLASFACSLEIGFSGTTSLGLVIPAMLKIHMLIGVAEALITLALVNIFRTMLKGE
ncbi:MAG: energy-coupling factor ABC transporter permease [Patescibacteria group bacterium]